MSERSFKSALSLIGSSEYSLLSLVLAVLFFKQLLEDPESQSRLGSSTGLGDHVHADILALADRKNIIQICRADVVADKIDIGSILLKIVVEEATSEAR